jgi:hypothetical protein
MVWKFNNNGFNASWSYFQSASELHAMIAVPDNLTGATRLIYGDERGINTYVDAGDGTKLTNVGQAILPSGSRNGNLQLAQFMSGAAQPSSLAADLAGALLYATTWQIAGRTSASNILQTGNLNWTGSTGAGIVGIVTDPSGSGNTYQERWTSLYAVSGALAPPDFFQLTTPGSPPLDITGLSGNTLTATGGDNQWAWSWSSTNFAVNPINNKGIIIGSGQGRVFRTQDLGISWFCVANPTTDPSLSGSAVTTLAFGAPDPNLPNNSTEDFMYYGNFAGNVYVSFQGGGLGNWKNLSAGLDGSQIIAIAPSPTRGSHEVYVLTLWGLYWMQDSSSATPTWVNITGGLYNLQRPLFGSSTEKYYTMRDALDRRLALTSLAVDWRFAIPDASGTHPVLYVSGDAGVYRSYDKGTTWNYYPSVAGDGALQDGGYLPNVQVTHLDLIIGSINPATGIPDESSLANSMNVLVATTFGRGDFAIRLNNKPFQQYSVYASPGPLVASIAPVTNATGTTLTGIQVTFKGQNPLDPTSMSSVDPSSFTTAAIAALSGPAGKIVPNSVLDITPTTAQGNLHNVYLISFNPQSTAGSYSLSLNQSITNFNGTPLAAAYTGKLTFTPNTPPTISSLRNQALPVNSLAAPSITGLIPFTVGDKETPAGQLSVTASSSDTTLVPTGNIVLLGSGANRTLQIAPALDLVGLSTITVTVTDALGLSTSASFTLTVEPPWVQQLIPNQTMLHDTTLTLPVLPPINQGNPPTPNWEYFNYSAVISGYSQAYNLKKQYGLSYPGSDYYNKSGQQEKYLRTNFGTTWAYILPSGKLYARLGTTLNLANDTLLAVLDSSYWVNTSLLYNAVLPAAPAVTVDSNGGIVKLTPPLHYTGTFQVTLISATPYSQQSQQFLVTVTGTAPMLANPGDQVITPGTTLPVTLSADGVASVFVTDGGSGYSTTTTTVNFTGGGGNGATGVPIISGGVVTGITITNPGSGYTAAPQVDIVDSGTVPGTGAQATASLNPAGLTFTATVSGYSQAYDLKQQYGLSYPGSDYKNARGQQEKYLKSSTTSSGLAYILPSGYLHAYVPHAGNVLDPSIDPVLAVLDPSYYAATSKLYNAQKPAVPAGVTLSPASPFTLTNNTGTLNIDALLTFAGTFRVTVTASDGTFATSQSFLVTTLTTQPMWQQPIADQTFNHAQGRSADLTLQAADTAGDTMTFTLVSVGYSRAFDLKQQYGLAYPGSDYYNQRGQREKYLRTNFGTTWAYILPDGKLYARVGTTLNLTADTLLATLDASYWANTSLLYNAKLPPPPAVTFIDASTLTPLPNSFTLPGNSGTFYVVPDAAFVGTFRVVVTASGGSPLSTSERSFLVTVTNETPQLQPISDVSVPHTQTPSVTLKATDADDTTINFTAAASGYSQAYDLKKQYGLAYPGSDYYNQRGQQEKYLRTNFGSTWAYILPDGKLYARTGTTLDLAKDSLLATLEPSYWANTRLLYNATQPAAPAVLFYDSPALLTPLTNPFTLAGNSGTLYIVPQDPNYNGTFRVTVTASDIATFSSLSFLVTVTNDTPQLTTIADQVISHTQGQVNVQLIGTDAEDQLNFTATASAYSLAYDLKLQYGLAYPGSDYYNQRGQREKYLRTNFGSKWAYILPNGNLYARAGTTLNLANDTLLATLDSGYWYNTKLLYNATASHAYDLKTVFGLSSFLNTDYYDARGQQERYLKCNFGTRMVYILPSGNLYAFNGTTLSPGTDQLLATLDPSYWANPGLLSGAAPAAVPPVTFSPGPNPFSLTNNQGTLTITPDPSFVGTFRVTITASDGLYQTSQSFLVTVTNGTPQWQAAIPAQSAPLIQVGGNDLWTGYTVSSTIQAIDPEGDEATFAATAQTYNQGYDLQQQFGLSYLGTTGYNARGMKEKYLKSSTLSTGRVYIIPDPNMLTARMYVFNGTKLDPANDTLLATLDISYYNDLRLLYTPPAPRDLTSLMTFTFNPNPSGAGITSLTITLKQPLDPFFTAGNVFRVCVTVSDGATSTSQFFLVTIL